MKVRQFHSILLLAHLVLGYVHTLRAMTVNRVNGGFNILYLDSTTPTSQGDINLYRAYNSLTALSEKYGTQGAFGFGFTSALETQLTITQQGELLLRDGSSGNTLAFQAQPSRGNKRRVVYVSSELGFQTIVRDGNLWVRTLHDGGEEVFDNQGRLITQRNGVSELHYEYYPLHPLQLRRITTRDQSSWLTLVWKKGHVESAIDSTGKSASYQYDDKGNCVQVVNTSGETFRYLYEIEKFPHLITQIEYFAFNLSDLAHAHQPIPAPQATRILHYNDEGLVTFHRDVDGTESKFNYGKDRSDPRHRFWTKVEKISTQGERTEEKDTFVLRERTQGSGHYLYKQSVSKGGHHWDIVYTECCGSPLQVTFDNELTTFRYNGEGQLTEKTSPKEHVVLKYESQWHKIKSVAINGVVFTYAYDSRGNLASATSTKNQKVKLAYDKHNRIIVLQDLGKHKATYRFSYRPDGKPATVSEEGVGKVKLVYTEAGDFKEAVLESPKRGVTAEPNARSRAPYDAQAVRKLVPHILDGFPKVMEALRPIGINFAEVKL